MDLTNWKYLFTYGYLLDIYAWLLEIMILLQKTNDIY